ncbi:MAG: hypothetical protein HW410_1321 [Nitrosarchaeum sp.]|jgi:hypothetical protein|nr:hypothetical protein [Nitrosarchaeum sp.]
MTLSKQQINLMDEMAEIEYGLITKLGNLINAEWDSNTLKIKIQELMKQRSCIEEELDRLA